MEAADLWAAVEFTAQNGSTEALLSHAAREGLHPYAVTPAPGGFRGRCAAWRYRRFAALAHRLHVRLRLGKRRGLFFWLRPLLRRRGLWVGTILFLPLLLWSQNLIWAVDYGPLNRQQQLQVAGILQQCQLLPGAQVTKAALAQGQYALLQSGGFVWASLNFAKGRLRVEAAAPDPEPDISAARMQGLRARCAGVVTAVELTSGTLLVTPGQQVEKGQGLIGTARSRRDGSLIFQPAVGRVTARFEWENRQQIPLEETLSLPGRKRGLSFRLFFKNDFSPCFRLFYLQSDNTLQRIFWLQPEFLGLVLPFSIEERTLYELQPGLITRTEAQGLALARMQSRKALYAAFPDARILARREDCHTEGTTLQYTVVYTVTADICD